MHIRCEDHGPDGDEIENMEWYAEVGCVGDSEAILCGFRNCRQPASAFLNAEECFEYEDGERVFALGPLKLELEDSYVRQNPDAQLPSSGTDF